MLQIRGRRGGQPKTSPPTSAQPTRSPAPAQRRPESLESVVNGAKLRACQALRTGMARLASLYREVPRCRGSSTVMEAGRPMTTFDDGKDAFGKKFAQDAEQRFKAMARRNRLFGQWAAAQLGRSGPEADAYARSVVMADFEETGDGDVLRKVLAD